MKKHYHHAIKKLSRTVVILLTGCILFMTASTTSADPQYPPTEYIINNLGRQIISSQVRG